MTTRLFSLLCSVESAVAHVVLAVVAFRWWARMRRPPAVWFAARDRPA